MFLLCLNTNHQMHTAIAKAMAARMFLAGPFEVISTAARPRIADIAYKTATACF